MKTIRSRLTRDLLAAILMLLGGGLVALYFAARDATTEEFDDVLDAKAFAASTLTAQVGQSVHVEFNDRFFRGFEDDSGRDFFELWDAADRPLARSESLSQKQDLPLQVGTVEKPRRWNFVLPNGRPGRAVGLSFPAKLGDGRPGAPAQWVRLVVASDREGLDETLWQLLGVSALSAVLVVAATLWTIPRVLRRGLEPLEQLAKQAAAIDAASLSTRFADGEIPGELLPIVKRWNELLARLERSFERERRFSADLAHELRTPVAELRTLAECALKWPEARDPATDAEALAIAKQMERLVTHILALARGEQGRMPVQAEAVDLAEILERVWSGFAKRAAARQLRTSMSLTPVRVWADPALLRSILTNLCENAVEYASAGGEIALVIVVTRDVTVVKIVNTVDGVQADDLPKFFDRFWRKETARTGGHHFGLGLSLARSFAEAMNWKLTANLDGPQQLVLQLTTAPTTHRLEPEVSRIMLR